MGLLSQKHNFRPPAAAERKKVDTLKAPKSKLPVRASKSPPQSTNLLGARPSNHNSEKASRVTTKHAEQNDNSAEETSVTKPRNLKRRFPERLSRASPAYDRVSSDEEAEPDDGWEEVVVAAKRRKPHDYDAIDTKRNVMHHTLDRGLRNPTDEHLEPLKIVNAADIASLELGCEPALGASRSGVAVELQYPASGQRERYELVIGKEKINAVNDIKSVVKLVTDFYLTSDEADPFSNKISGLIRRLERASSDQIRDLHSFKSALEEYNSRLYALLKDGIIADNIRRQHHLPTDLVKFILDQVYDRTVAPKVDLLRRYKSGSDNVYGELKPDFITDILVRRARMTSDLVFVDLGSGVGNVVLQAALQVGCESWGCEEMEHACNLAEAAELEFTARCGLWGIAPGRVHLERGDFRSNGPISEALKRADVVLVNNEAFTSKLNDDLVRMFLDLKSGCRIVSLKSFVHHETSGSHNINDVGSRILDVERFTYPTGFVSWKASDGKFCISTKKHSI